MTDLLPLQMSCCSELGVASSTLTICCWLKLKAPETTNVIVWDIQGSRGPHGCGVGTFARSCVWAEVHRDS